MEIYKGIILGILQGLTEFLPVSSSGHLVLGQHFFGITQSVLSFDVSVHMGTLAAVILVFFSDIKLILLSLWKLLLKILKREPFVNYCSDDEHVRLALMIVAASVPTALIGFYLKRFEEILFSSITLVGFMLIVTGTVLWFTKTISVKEPVSTDIGLFKAVFIGIIQGLAVIPGISRSGSTIAAGMFLKLDRDFSARFSFLLSIPAILGAQILSLKDSFSQGALVEQATVYGTLASFITGYFALVVLLRIVKQGRLYLFAPYCWIVGAVLLFFKMI